MEAIAPNPRPLTTFEIVVHGLADGLALYILLSELWPQLWPDRPAFDFVESLFALLVLGLSSAIMVRRFRPELRALRLLDRGLSILAAALGALGAVFCLAVMVSGAMYKGPSPDAGGMGLLAGLVLFYPRAALLFLPFALNASRLIPYGRWRLGLLGVGLFLLPLVLLLGLSALRHLQGP